VVIGVVGFMEYGVLRLLAVFRLGALVRVTYYEALLQPFTLIVILLTLTAIIICTFVPYYTFDEDNKMYRDIATQFCILAGLAVMVFASAKVVDEEIENRTMLTLMSKPIARWQVVLGKYLGILCIVFTVLVVLGATTSTASYLHWLDDKRIDYNVSRGGEIADLTSQLYKALLALIPLFLLQFLQIATLAAIAVAISTRYPLALNVTVIAIVYITANLTAFIPGLGLAQPWRGLATYGSYLLPYLSNFDISQRLIYGYYTIGHQESIDYFRKGVPSLGEIWEYTALAGVYAVFYIGAALSVAMALFRTRELT
jgi:ABC-type transport system involved in multi-copper enzyme maturation permease subunit